MKTENKLVIAGTIAIIAIILAGQLCMNMDVKNEYCVNYEGDVATYEINLGYVRYQRVKQRALFGLEDIGNGLRIINISAQTINRVGRKRNQFSAFYGFGGAS